MAAQLKPVWQSLRDKNASFKLKQHACRQCNFRTDSLLAMDVHKQTLHIDAAARKIQCGLCSEFNTNNTRMQKHYL